MNYHKKNVLIYTRLPKTILQTSLPNMYPNILTGTQIELLALIRHFDPKFYLVGGTALALQLGHRRSIDFDLFTPKPLDGPNIRATIKRYRFSIGRILIETQTEFTLFINGIKTTFYVFPYSVEHKVNFEGISLPDVLTIASMKAFALGQRAKWKDYVDLFFIFKTYSLKQVVEATKANFGTEFDEKLFREQLSYFKDINYSEQIEFMPGFRVEDNVIREELTKISLT